MKLIVAGSRTLRKREIVEMILNMAVRDGNLNVSEVVHGGAVGVDLLAQAWARRKGIKTKAFLPDWKSGPRAALDRNAAMAQYGDCLIAIWDGQSTGTAHMITRARLAGKPVQIVYVDYDNTFRFDRSGAIVAAKGKREPSS